MFGMKWCLLFAAFSLFFFCVSAQVNPQNGAAQFSLPLYSYSDAGNRLSFNASLDYVDGNGLPVSEMASAVGTGWTLNCGGVISRIQRGQPDDQKLHTTLYTYNSDQFGVYVQNDYPDGYLYNSTYSPSDVIDDGGTYTPYQQGFTTPPAPYDYVPAPKYTADREQDIFEFNFNGRSGKFVIGQNHNVETLTDSKLKINISEADMSASGIRTQISQFTITDESGIQYIFKDLELGYVVLYNQLYPLIASGDANVDVSSLTYTRLAYLNPSFTGINLIMGRYIDNSSIVNKWYLSAIVNPLTGKQITINYTPYQEDFNTDKQVQYSVNSSGQSATNVTVYWDRNKIQGQRVSSVVFPDNERLDLTYSSQPRIDLPLENQLNSIQVSSNGNRVYSWQFGYGYMVGFENAIKDPASSFNAQETQWSRLCLQNIEKTGTNGISEPPYRFSYNLGGGSLPIDDYVPPMFSIYQDKFGYYNAGVTGVDKSVEGSWTSFYSENELKQYVLSSLADYRKPYLTSAKNGILQSVTYPTGGSLTYTYEANQPQGQLGGVRVANVTRYDGISHSNDMVRQYAYVNADEATSSGWGGDNLVFKTTQSATAQACSSTKLNPASAAKQFASNYIQHGFVTGQFGFESATALSSTLAGALEGVVVAIFVSEIIEALSGSPSTITDTYTQYTNVSQQAGNTLPWGYARTEVSDQVTINNSLSTTGKTVYEYSYPGGSLDHPIDVPVPSFPSSFKPRYADWVYGLPETITVYDNQSRIVKQTKNVYHFIVNNIIDPNNVSSSWVATSYLYGCTLVWPGPANETTNIQQESYYPMTGHTELLSTQEILYNSSGQATGNTTTNFDYDINYQLKDQYANNSKGETIKTIYYHPYDYSQATGGIGQMNSSGSNILTPVVSTETYITKSDGNQYMTGATATSYQQTYNGDIKPSITYTFQNPVPIASTVLQPFNAANVVRDPSYYQQVSSYSYDNYGNAAQVITGGNRITSSLYDYFGKLQVATVKNASFNDIYYTSFEAEGDKPGATVNTLAVTSSDARTGDSCFNLSDPSTSTSGYFGFNGFNNTLNYIVSFWSKGGSACISGLQDGSAIYSSCQGTSGWKQGETVNGWTYYEVQVNQIDQIKVSGSGLIDEFRVYPVGALMSTTTYSPLVGKTSECGPDNKVIYYQYDELGRLQYILDDQKNIVRKYDYNYKQ